MKYHPFPTALLYGALGLLALGCGDRNSAEATVSPAPAPARQVHTLRLTVQDRVETIRLIGSVEPVHDVTVSAEVQGRIAARLKDVGATVAMDEVLFRIDDARLQFDVARAEADLQRLQATLAQDRRDLKRAENLYQGSIASVDALESARTKAGIGEASERAARAALDRLRRDLADTQVRSPINGHVVERWADVGELVNPGTPLIRLVDTSRVKIVTRINEVDLAKVHVGVTAAIQFDAYPDAPLSGPVTAIAVQADRATRTFPIVIELPNRETQALKAGMVARVDLPGTRFPNVVVLPQDSIVERGDRKLAYVLQPDGTVAEREIAVGRVFGSDAVVTAGLSAGDEVVIRGQFTLRDGDAVRAVEPAA